MRFRGLPVWLGIRLFVQGYFPVRFPTPNLFDCMKNCVLNMGIPLEDAVLAATENPVESIGVEKDYGRIAVGNYGNLLLLDKDLHGIRPAFEKLDCLDYAGLDAVFTKYKGIKAIIHFAGGHPV